MTVANQTNRIAAVGNAAIGQEVPFSFPITATSDLLVKKRVTATGVETTLDETTNYTVEIDGDVGGTLTTVTAIEVTEQIHIIRNSPKTQSLDLEQGGSFNAENIEDALDKTTKLIIENKDAIGKAITFPPTDAAALIAKLPNSIDRASKNLTFDSDGNVAASVSVEEGSVSFTTFGTSMAETTNVKTARTLLDLGWFDIRDYGAVDGAADNTTEIQDAIDTADGHEPVYFPEGEWMVSNLTLPSGTRLIGANKANVTIKAIVGTTGNVIEDDGNAQWTSIADLIISGNDCDVTCLELGFNTNPFGSSGYLNNLMLRDCQNYGLKVKGNVGVIDNIEIFDCDDGMYLDGPANLVSNITIGHQTTGSVGLRVVGSGNVINNIHTEKAEFTTGDVHISGNNTFISGLEVTVDAAATATPCVVIDLNAWGTIIKGIAATIGVAGTLEFMIEDNCFSVAQRKVVGHKYGTTYRYIPEYMSGDAYHFLSPVHTPPTTGKYIKGDIAWEPGGLPGFSIGWSCIGSGEPGVWSPLGTVVGAVDKNATYSVTVGDNGNRFSNFGAGAAIEFDLPAAIVGMKYSFLRLATHELRLDPNVAETIRGGGAGEYLQLDADGDNVTIQCVKAGTWEITSQVGTPSFE